MATAAPAVAIARWSRAGAGPGSLACTCCWSLVIRRALYTRGPQAHGVRLSAVDPHEARTCTSTPSSSRRWPPGARAGAARQRARRAARRPTPRTARQLRARRQPDVGRLRGGARWPGGRPRPRARLRDGCHLGGAVARAARRHRRRPRHRPTTAPCDLLDRLRAGRRHGRCGSTRPTPRASSRTWTGPTSLARVADEPAHGRHRPRDRARRGTRARASTSVVDNTLPTPLAVASAGPRRRRRRALGHEVPLGPQRRRARGHDRGRRHRRAGRASVSASAATAPCTARSPGRWRSTSRLRGLRTLALRFERACANAAELAARLHGHPAVARVRYPAAGAMLAIDVAGDADAAERVCAATRVWLHSTSLGGVESQLERRRRHPRESASRARATSSASPSASSTSTTSGPTSTRPSRPSDPASGSRRTQAPTDDRSSRWGPVHRLTPDDVGRPRRVSPAAGHGLAARGEPTADGLVLLGLEVSRHESRADLPGRSGRHGRRPRPARQIGMSTPCCWARVRIDSHDLTPSVVCFISAAACSTVRPRPSAPRRSGCATAGTCTWR